MSSDILSRPIDAEQVLADLRRGAEEPRGRLGVTVVLIRESWLERANKGVPTMLRYATHAKNNSLYNTPPMFGIYVLDLVLRWVDSAWAASRGDGQRATTGQGRDPLRRDRRSAAAIYQAGTPRSPPRSRMNVTFRLSTRGRWRNKFVAETQKAEGMVGLAGHRSVGGVASVDLQRHRPRRLPVAGERSWGDFAAKNGQGSRLEPTHHEEAPADDPGPRRRSRKTC